MTQIVGFSGKKQSGKNTCCNFIVMLKLIENGVCKKAKIGDDGLIYVSDVFGESIKGQEYFKFDKPDVNTDAVLETLNEVKLYALADKLKQMAVEVFGLEPEMVYGTNKQKNQKTRFLWQDMPGMDLNYKATYSGESGKKNKMTARQFLQYMGTEVFRNMYEDIWLDSMMRQIEKDNPKLALVSDARFDNEIRGIQKSGGIVLGLTRDLFNSKDTHASEQVQLDLCDKIIDNEKLDIAEQNKAVYLALKDLNCKYLTDLGV